MSVRRKAVREGRVLLVVPDSEELARIATGLRSAGWRVSALSRFEAAPPAYSSTAPDMAVLVEADKTSVPAPVIQRLATLSRCTLPIWVACERPAAYSGDDKPSRVPVVGVLPTPLDVGHLSARLRSQMKWGLAIHQASRRSTDFLPGRLKDPLTGACSRGLFIESITQQIHRAERFGAGFSILVCGLNGFRRFKKRFGTARAERFLVYLTIVLGQTLRECDVVARIRENEFAILLDATQAEGLAEVRSRLSARFEAAKFQLEGDWISPSVSLGGCSFPDVLGPPEALLRAAYRDQRATASRAEDFFTVAVAGDR
jgi:two-component system cell cycle response regulator